MSDPPKAFALKFISGKYQGGEFPLQPDREVVIGRAPDLDMVLAEEMVSRRHARLLASAEGLLLQDLGSTNGTFVNGEKVRSARLKEGDRVLIGTSILKVVARDAWADTGGVGEPRPGLQTMRTQDTTMSGRIEDVPLPDLLQLLQTSKRSGVLAVEAERRGRIYLREGRVYYAVIEDDHDLGPQKAFNRMVAWERGAFRLGPPSTEEFMIELEESTEALLMEALRQLDELRRVQADLPAATTPLALESPMMAPLRDLGPEQLDVLQVVHNHGTLQDVLDRADTSDLDTARHLRHLLRRGYLREA